MSDTAPSPLETLSSALADIVALVSPSVVGVESTRSRSSGFVWRPNLVVTADEALAEEGGITVTVTGGARHAATIVGRDASTDVALLRVEGAALPAVTLRTLPLRAGELALAVGADALALWGVVAAAGPSWHSMRGGEIDARIELDVRLRRHAEGGLTLDARGWAFGMAVFGPRRRTLVIPAATIDRVATQLERNGRIPRGYLGLGLQPVRAEDDGAAGAIIISLDKNGLGGRRRAAPRRRSGELGWATAVGHSRAPASTRPGQHRAKRRDRSAPRRSAAPTNPHGGREAAGLSKENPAGPLVIALRLDDQALAERVARVLVGVSGVRLAGAGEPADVALVAPTSMESNPEAPLTPRELEVLTLLAEGASNKVIARRLGISVHTAKFHVGQVLDKLDATGRTDAVAHAARQGVIHL